MGVQRITVVANKAWSLLNPKSLPSWVRVAPQSGIASDSEGEGNIVNVTVEGGYFSPNERSVNLIFAITDDQTKTAVVTVWQNGAAPTIRATPAAITFDADGSPVLQG